MKKLSLASFRRRPEPDPEPRCECPIRVRNIGEPLAHSKICPVRKAYERYLRESARAESERAWAA